MKIHPSQRLGNPGVYPWGDSPGSPVYHCRRIYGYGNFQCGYGAFMWRKTVFLVGVFLIPRFAGITNVFYTEPLSDFLGTVVSVLMFCLVFKRVVGNPHERKETVA